jgi:hypothetical protein
MDSQNINDSLPNATYVGVTGTPIDGTLEVLSSGDAHNARIGRGRNHGETVMKESCESNNE